MLEMRSLYAHFSIYKACIYSRSPNFDLFPCNSGNFATETWKLHCFTQLSTTGQMQWTECHRKLCFNPFFKLSSPETNWIYYTACDPKSWIWEAKKRKTDCQSRYRSFILHRICETWHNMGTTQFTNKVFEDSSPTELKTVQRHSFWRQFTDTFVSWLMTCDW